MIDLTPLDVRNKRGDFKRGIRGYDSEEVDTFLELVAERMEELVREKLSLEEKVGLLDTQVQSQAGREKAVNDALVTAQQLREDIQGQARREADGVVDDARRMAESTVNNAQAEANAILDRAKSDAKVLRRELDYEIEMVLRDANRRIQDGGEALKSLERARIIYLKGLRSMMQRQMDSIEVEEARPPLDQAIPEVELPPGWREQVLSKGEEEGYLKVPGLLDDDLGGLADPKGPQAGADEAEGIQETGAPDDAEAPPPTSAAPGTEAATDAESEAPGNADAKGPETAAPTETIDEDGFEVREYGAWSQPLVGEGDEGEESPAGRGDS
jgi:DivIVA domain-containing protein